jgi:16S rRNA (guanine966-N2)-methyltransferase
MRVVAGTAGGRRLRAPAGATTRPTADRVREAMFSMIASRMDLEGAEVADLFAGSGALGIEALSRGARRVIFVENDREAVATIRANLQALGLAARGEVVVGDALRSVHGLPRPVDLVVADPPYAYPHWPALLSALEGRATLAVLETGSDLELPAGWSSVGGRRHGASVVTIARPAGGPAGAGEPKGEK